MIHDKTDTPHWSSEVEDWKEEFDHNDVVIGLDSQERFGEGTLQVSRIDFTSDEYVEHLGLFWKKREANRHASAFNDRVQESREERDGSS